MKFPSFFSKSLIAAAVGCIVSQVFVGCTSFEETKKLADAGNPEKQYEVALMYRDGDGVPVDNKKSAEYMMQALDNNYMPAAWETVQDIYRKKDVKRASAFIKAYEILLTTQPLNFNDIKASVGGAMHVKSIGVRYLQLLAKNDSLQTKELRELFLNNLPAKHLDRRERYKLQQTISKIYSAAEIAEAKRIAEQKRIAEEKRIAEAKLAAENAKKAALAKLEDPKFKYPYRTKERPGVKLYKDIYSGTSDAWGTACKKITGKDPFQANHAYFLMGRVSEKDMVVYAANIELDASGITFDDLVKKYKAQFPDAKVSVKDERNAKYEQIAQGLKRTNPAYSLWTTKRIKEMLHKELANYDFRIFTLQNANVKIEISKNELVSYKISVKDLKYSKLVDAYKVELKKQEEIKRKQQAQKALDF